MVPKEAQPIITHIIRFGPGDEPSQPGSGDSGGNTGEAEPDQGNPWDLPPNPPIGDPNPN